MGGANGSSSFYAEYGWRMGGIIEILNWENGTRVACNNCMCANRIELEICISYISVTDKVDINETNTSIATGLLYV